MGSNDDKLGFKDIELIRYLILNWRISLLNIYFNTKFQQEDKKVDEAFIRTVNRCGVILSMIKSSQPGLEVENNLREKIMGQLSILMEEIETLVSENTTDLGEPWAVDG